MRKILRFLICFYAAFSVFAKTPNKDGGFTITCVPASHFVKTGEQIKFNVTSEKDALCDIIITQDAGKVLKRLTQVKAPQTMTYTSDKPGFVRCSVRAKGVKADAAVAVSPEKIVAVGKAPDDYDEFWKKTFEESAKLPLDMEVTKLEHKGNWNYFRLSCANINGKRAYGLLAIPKKIFKPVPLVVSFGGGEAYCDEVSLTNIAVYTQRRVKRDIAVLLLHLPPYAPAVNSVEAKKRHKEFLKELGNARRYITWKETLTCKEAFYARSAVTGCVRLLDYIAQMKEIDAKNIVFRGASHGGKFGAYLCCFSKHIKAAFCGVPSSCEFQAMNDNRRSSLAKEWRNHPDITNYYDIVWCAKYIKCPVLVSVGFVDNSCPPTGVYAFYNALKCPKQLYNKVEYGHGGAPADYEAAIWNFLSANIDK